MPADTAVTESASQTTQPASEASEAQSQPHPTASINADDLMTRLGIPQAMRSEVAQESTPEEVPAVAPEEIPAATPEGASQARG